jgi:hypothetical protein
VAEGGRIEPGTHARDPLSSAEYNAITDQAAELVHQWEARMAGKPVSAGRLDSWIGQALAILREVAAGG